MPNIKLTIAYDGTRYAGWQIQKNAGTIQGEIEKALKKILKKKVHLIAAGRTDSGVHARAQIANFTLSAALADNSAVSANAADRVLTAFNSNLPKDIRIIKIEEAPFKFHSRFSAKGKIYRYTILNSKTDDPFLQRYYHKVPYRLKFNLMKKEAKVLEGKRDFKSFQAKSALSPVKDTVRKMKKISLTKKDKFIYITLEADGFLHNMVRNIVGTLIEIGRGHFSEGSMKGILMAKERKKAGPTAPAKGLSLIKVKY